MILNNCIFIPPLFYSSHCQSACNIFLCTDVKDNCGNNTQGKSCNKQIPLCAGSTSEHEKIYRQRSQFTVSNENTGKQKVIPGPHKNNTPMVTVAGLTSGNTICVIIRKTPHPSIAAASSSSRGTFFKNPVNVRIPKRTEESNIKNDNSSKGIGKIGICSKYRNRNHNCMKRHDLSENKIQIQIL